MKKTYNYLEKIDYNLTYYFKFFYLIYAESIRLTNSRADTLLEYIIFYSATIELMIPKFFAKW